MRAYEFLTMQEEVLRKMLCKDFGADVEDVVVVIAPSSNPEFTFMGILSVRVNRLEVFGNTLAETMVKLCVEYGILTQNIVGDNVL